jgi:hypothetical protein
MFQIGRAAMADRLMRKNPGFARLWNDFSSLPSSFSDEPSPPADLEHPFALSLSIEKMKRKTHQ